LKVQAMDAAGNMSQANFNVSAAPSVNGNLVLRGNLILN